MYICAINPSKCIQPFPLKLESDVQENYEKQSADGKKQNGGWNTYIYSRYRLTKKNSQEIYYKLQAHSDRKNGRVHNNNNIWKLESKWTFYKSCFRSNKKILAVLKKAKNKPVYTVFACAKSLQSCPTLCDSMDIAHQAPLSMGFSRQEYWSRLQCPSPGDLPVLGIDSRLLHLLLWQASSLPLMPPGKPNLYRTLS